MAGCSPSYVFGLTLRILGLSWHSPSHLHGDVVETNVLSKTLTKISCDFVIFDVLRIEFSIPSKIDVYF